MPDGSPPPAGFQKQKERPLNAKGNDAEYRRRAGYIAKLYIKAWEKDYRAAAKGYWKGDERIDSIES